MDLLTAGVGCTYCDLLPLLATPDQAILFVAAVPGVLYNQLQ